MIEIGNDWTEINPNPWTWLVWENPNEKVTGWIVAIREETFNDKHTGELRQNPVCYFIDMERNVEPVRFIVPTDLRRKIEKLEESLKASNLTYDDVMVRITYIGKHKSPKGYEVKQFNLQAKREPIHDKIKEMIPELPEPNEPIIPNPDFSYDYNDEVEEVD